MKKSVVIAAMGLVVGAVSSFGQGSMTFNSYFANDSIGIPINFSSALGGDVVTGSAYSVDLLYSLTPITDAASGNGALTAGWLFSGSGSPSQVNVATTFGTGAAAGFFQGPNFVLNPYTVGSTVYFEVIVYQTAAGSYANSTIRGHSASFSDTLGTGINPATVINFLPFTVATVAPVPEPTTLALAGLGGLASLVMLRRKNA